jgi:hypothetical protein
MSATLVGPPRTQGGGVDSLRWFSRGASVGGAKVKLCIWAVWGSNGRPVVSGAMADWEQTEADQSGSAEAGAMGVSSGVVGSPPSR